MNKTRLYIGGCTSLIISKLSFMSNDINWAYAWIILAIILMSLFLFTDE